MSLSPVKCWTRQRNADSGGALSMIEVARCPECTLVYCFWLPETEHAASNEYTIFRKVYLTCGCSAVATSRRDKHNIQRL